MRSTFILVAIAILAYAAFTSATPFATLKQTLGVAFPNNTGINANSTKNKLNEDEFKCCLPSQFTITAHFDAVNITHLFTNNATATNGTAAKVANSTLLHSNSTGSIVIYKKEDAKSTTYRMDFHTPEFTGSILGFTIGNTTVEYNATESGCRCVAFNETGFINGTNAAFNGTANNGTNSFNGTSLPDSCKVGTFLAKSTLGSNLLTVTFASNNTFRSSNGTEHVYHTVHTVSDVTKDSCVFVLDQTKIYTKSKNGTAHTDMRTVTTTTYTDFSEKFDDKKVFRIPKVCPSFEQCKRQ